MQRLHHLLCIALCCLISAGAARAEEEPADVDADSDAKDESKEEATEETVVTSRRPWRANRRTGHGLDPDAPASRHVLTRRDLDWSG